MPKPSAAAAPLVMPFAAPEKGLVRPLPPPLLGGASSLGRPTLVMFGLFTLLLGVFYPVAVTGVAQLVFPAEANGSVLYRGTARTGSALIGQPFTDPALFWSRPSATSPYSNNAEASTGSNLGPSNPALQEAVAARVAALRAADPGGDASVPVPIDLVTASGSGLDPHISPAAAAYQVGRVARTRSLSEESVHALVAAHTEGRWLGIVGEPRVNVLRLNLALTSLPR